jgi:serine/threonine protein kinase/ABC-type branched-subunit amino acid transport system substrate-binding protein
MECPYCKYENRDGVHYCSNCGRALNTVSTSTSSSTQTGGNSRTLTVGTTLQGGRYVIKQILGEGGMGAALLATDKRLDGKTVVIKELISDSTDPLKYQEDERNFKQEVVTLAHLDHPLIPSVTDNFEEGSGYFMVQEYVEGENLEERMNRIKQPMKERDVLGCASEVLDVLDYLSQQTPPIVHRDIKPANIIIGSKDRRAHLVDFGIARADVARNVRRKQTSALGTPGYAPPEQYQGNADPRSDLYALGATMHHLLTNRDPRDYPPFIYPPVRTLNPQLSPQVERVIARVVNNDITQRYQSAAAMKRDVDDILLKRFGISGNISSYTLGTSGPVTAADAAAYTNPAAYANQPAQVQQPRITPLPPPPTSQPRNVYAPPARQLGGNNVGRNFLLFVIVIVLLGVLAFAALNFLQRQGQGQGTNTATPGTTVQPAATVPASGIGVTKVNGENIGISDGTVVFDTRRTDGDLKQQATQKLASGDISGAQALWSEAASKDTSDAEALIYREDQRVITSSNPYITIVVATMLTGDNATVSVGRDNLQGAYVAQKEFNDRAKLPNSVKVRLLIANAGSKQEYTKNVAQQIVQLAQADKTFVGVMGWPFSGYAGTAIGVLSAARIPMVSQTASSDALTGISPYFFRIAPPNKDQAIVGAKYAEQVLHAKKVALFYDPANLYTQSLANAFSTQFTGDGNQIVATEKYTVGKQSNFTQLLNDAESQNPDLIYFAGYGNDASVLLTDLPTSGAFANLQIMGGDALYELGGYTSSASGARVRLHFTSFAYPDEWQILCAQKQTFACSPPSFFTEYKAAYDPNNQHKTGSPYGYSRADGDTILSYDALLVMLHASSNALTGAKTNMTPADLLQALKKIQGAQAVQGVSGQISFGSDGDPVNKAIVVLKVAPGGFFQMDSVKGCFQVGHC